MACLASKELDGIEEKSMSQFPSSLNSSLLPSAQTRLQGAIIRLWPLGLVLANAAVGLRGFQRKLVVCACLQLPSDNLSTCKVQTAQGQTGVVSIRALPQVRCDAVVLLMTAPAWAGRQQSLGVPTAGRPRWDMTFPGPTGLRHQGSQDSYTFGLFPVRAGNWDSSTALHF